jgi:hypothetical protein
MNNDQRRALASYVREVMDIVGLPHWKLILVSEYPDDDYTGIELGYCKVIFGHHTARMWFADDLMEELPSSQRYVVIHEIVHIFMQGPWDAWNETLSKDGLLSRSTYEAISTNAIVAWEHSVDLIARALGVYIPFIDWEAKPDDDWIPTEEVDEMHIVSRMWKDAGHEVPRS